MSDYCWLRIQIRHVDIPIWREVFEMGEDSDFDECFGSLEEEFNNSSVYMADEASHAWYEELTHAASRGCRFHGYHGHDDSDEYPAKVFYGYGGRYKELPLSHDELPYVEVTKEGRTRQRDREHVAEFFRELDAVQNEFGEEKQYFINVG